MSPITDQSDHYPLYSTSPESLSPTSTSQPTQPLSRPQRTNRTPSYLSNYLCCLVASNSQNSLPFSTNHPISAHLSHQKLSNQYRGYILSISFVTDPTIYHGVVKLQVWHDAVRLELQALRSNNTWSVESLPPWKKVAGCKWVFKTKFNSDGLIDKHKARLVAKGYTQQEGIDFLNTFSPVANLVTVKLLLSLAAINN